MRFTACLLFLAFTTLNVFSQKTDTIPKKTTLFIGAGNYEYAHVGIASSFKQKFYVEFALGIKPWGFKQSNYQMAYLCLGTKLFKKRTFFFTPGIHLKCLVWHFNNEYNRFVVLGINPEFRITKKMNDHFVFGLTAGGLYNSPLYYQRKTYEEVGWPKEWQPSFSIQLFYFIK